MWELRREKIVKLPAVALKAVILVIPRGAKERVMLEEDLRRMGCHGLMERPWAFKQDRIVGELLAAQDNRWTKIVCEDPGKWTVAAWRKVYSFPICSKRMAGRTEKFVDGKFKNPPSLKDGYVVVDCKDVKTRQVLEFLILLL